GQYSTSLTDFRAGPVILVGAFNNDWTKRLFARTRFTFVRQNKAYCLQDARKPEDRSRCIDYGLPYLQLTEDFAIVSRVFDPDTGKVVVNAAGLTGFGTAETGEFLSDEDNLAPVLKIAPPGWEKLNLQIVLATKVIQGSSGHPRIVDVHVW
ncbi:MAG: hypothetical protein HZB13_16945, partial [Acidobacteria bacterium]|nr:hypothetical protein [Acidobacteriota bacterium]